MDQDTANRLFEVGAFVVFLAPPPAGIDFGIDMNSWELGRRFSGLKLIPPGLHFIHSGGVSGIGRVGFFHFFTEREIVVANWDTATEQIEAAPHDSDQVERLRANLRTLDSSLGPYPLNTTTPSHQFTTYQRWLRLTQHITPNLLSRVIPTGYIGSMTSVSRFSDVVSPSTNMETSSTLANTEWLHFTWIDLKRSFPQGASGAELTRYSIDKSYLLRKLLEGQYSDYKDLLGELELSFIIFLVGQVYDGLEQWKILVTLLCSCHELLELQVDMFIGFTGVLLVQLQELPEDFFIDALSGDSFLRHALRMYTSSVASTTSYHTPMRAMPRNTDLVRSMDTLLDFVENYFQWELRTEARLAAEGDEEEEGEYAPVIVNSDDDKHHTDGLQNTLSPDVRMDEA
ncbi:hypothetical protein SmJEL517_g04181 [Synchytrium microbalum]|uniref:Protein AAR2 homolog n=1 Tax=Synchytrium microbalum TaxID=1806994 RepID=A0A507BT87_9FUNG|nr:uncharacterized protein SmJEL517_g04181 [Synchytrium microbalum]TPX32780.1 hypothetical protein SmJEL517_g04181 [Synchytrium microbalum]